MKGEWELILAAVVASLMVRFLIHNAPSTAHWF